MKNLIIEGDNLSLRLIVGNSAVLAMSGGALTVDDFEGNSHVVAAGCWTTASLEPIVDKDEQ